MASKKKVLYDPQISFGPEPPSPLENPLFPVAMLKVAMELCKGDGRTFETIVQQTIDLTRLDPAAFVKYLECYLEVLRVAERGEKKGK